MSFTKSVCHVMLFNCHVRQPNSVVSNLSRLVNLHVLYAWMNNWSLHSNSMGIYWYLLYHELLIQLEIFGDNLIHILLNFCSQWLSDHSCDHYFFLSWVFSNYCLCGRKQERKVGEKGVGGEGGDTVESLHRRVLQLKKNFLIKILLVIPALYKSVQYYLWNKDT